VIQWYPETWLPENPPERDQGSLTVQLMNKSLENTELLSLMGIPVEILTLSSQMLLVR
jgi:hypothetical protein